MTGGVSLTREITQERIDAYAAASGDHNPIHVDPAFAAATPFGGTIAHGMLVLALVGELLYREHGEAWSAGGRLKVRFKAPTRPGAAVTASATLVREADGVREYEVSCTDVSGETLVEGRAAVPVERA